MSVDVFISYSHQDKSIADAACATLEASGIRCWIAPRDVAPGAEWAGSIVEAIDGCRVLVLIFSAHSNQSKQILREVQHAFEREVPVVPFRVENITPERSLAYYMESVHWLDALEPPLEDHLKRLTASVSRFLQVRRGGATQARAERLAAAKSRAGEDEVSTCHVGSEPARTNAADAHHSVAWKSLGGDFETIQRNRSKGWGRFKFAFVISSGLAATLAITLGLLIGPRLWPEGSGSLPAPSQPSPINVTPPIPSPPPVQAPPVQVPPATPVPPNRTEPINAPAASPYPLSADRERALRPKDTFTECPVCPEMVVVPANAFVMGSPSAEPGRDIDEGPQHVVTFRRPFAVGKFTVTFDEWDACVSDGGCNGYRPGDQGWGRGRYPVIYVNWSDAKAYVSWLSRKTSKTYRLLSEAEREYVGRAGTTTPFWFGNSISLDQANYGGADSYSQSTSGFRKQTVPVNTYRPNPWLLYQVHGNVREWTDDCYNDSYREAPRDGAPWLTGDCKRRVLRNGSWVNMSTLLRSAFRGTIGNSDIRSDTIGFRVARPLLSP